MTLTYDLWPWPQNEALFLLITLSTHMTMFEPENTWLLRTLGRLLRSNCHFRFDLWSSDAVFHTNSKNIWLLGSKNYYFLVAREWPWLMTFDLGLKMKLLSHWSFRVPTSLCYLVWFSSYSHNKPKVKSSRSPMTFDLDIFRCTICHLRWMVKVPSLYD